VHAEKLNDQRSLLDNISILSIYLLREVESRAAHYHFGDDRNFELSLLEFRQSFLISSANQSSPWTSYTRK
jgi:hypothetical protein